MKCPLSVLTIVVAMFSVPLLASASCKDIETSCANAYHLDLAACTKNFSGSQYDDCIKRAEAQFNNCYNGAGCK